MDEQMLLQLMAPPRLEAIHRLLCIQPHPDDNELGMGGTIAKLVSEGCTVDYLTVTDGALGDMGLHDPALPLARVREQEARAAGKHLGAEQFFFLRKADGSLEQVPELAHSLAEILRRGRYDAIACPDPWNSYEAHQDHVITGLAAAQAAINCNLKEYPAGTDTAPLELKAVIFYFTAAPNSFPDITEQFEKKMEAAALHRSQLSPQLLELYRGYFSFRGQKFSGSERICEPLKVLAPLHLHCIPEASVI